jgi:hypothetical protein
VDKHHHKIHSLLPGAANVNLLNLEQIQKIIDSNISDRVLVNIDPSLPDWHQVRVKVKGRGVSGHLSCRPNRNFMVSNIPVVDADNALAVSPATYHYLTVNSDVTQRGRSGGRSSHQIKGAPHGSYYFVNTEAIRHFQYLQRCFGREDLIIKSSCWISSSNVRGREGTFVIDHALFSLGRVPRMPETGRLRDLLMWIK